MLEFLGMRKEHGNRPSEFLPIVDKQKFISTPTDSEQDRLEFGVTIVGGGPAGLACSIRLMQRLKDEPDLKSELGEFPVVVIEKGKRIGNHLLSGASMRSSAMEQLFPEMQPEDWPVFGKVEKESLYFMTPKLALPIKPIPPNFRNEGNYIVSISQLGRFLADQAEQLGVQIVTETAAVKLLVEDNVVRGIRTGDKGRGKNGEELSYFEPGSDIITKATVLAEGTTGHLSMAAVDHFQIQGDNPKRWELGIKEVWGVKKPLDRVIHTVGWPLRMPAKYKEFGGSFIYPMGNDKVSLGYVVGLDYKDATFSPHDVLQKFKTHPFICDMLEDGERIEAGAKTIPSGGYWALPKNLSVPGMCIAGDCAGMVNIPELKGIHYAMHAGMLAADAIVDALKNNSNDFGEYDRKVRESLIGKDLYRTRNVRQVFSNNGLILGGIIAGSMLLTSGRFPGGHVEFAQDADEPMHIGDAEKKYPIPDNELTFDKLSNVFVSRNDTRDTAPNHIIIRRDVPGEIALTWENLCPAKVYEIPENQRESARKGEYVVVQVNPSNCIQCGAINAKGGRLTPPEGGSGPKYQEM